MHRSRPAPRGALVVAVSLLAVGAFAPPARAVAPFTLEVVDASPGNIVGEFSSMKVDHLGHPHVAYYDDLNGDLKYAFHDGTAWSIQVADGSSNDVGQYCSLALDSLDRPHIAYYDGTNGRLMYAARLGGAWIHEVADDASFDCGWYPSIAVDRAGTAWIASYDRGAGNPRISRRPSGGGWFGEYIDTTANLSGLFCSMATDTLGRPYVAYYDYTDHKLVFATLKLNAKRTAFVWSQETADSSADDVGLYASLRVDRFYRVHVAYMDLTSADLRWALRDNPSGQWTHETVHSGAQVFSLVASRSRSAMVYSASDMPG